MQIATILRISTLVTLVAAAMIWLHPGSLQPAPADAEETVTVLVGNIWFCGPEYLYDFDDPEFMCETVINVGDTVLWDFTPSDTGFPEDIHSATDCGVSCDDLIPGPLFDSGMLPEDGNLTFEFTFEQPGTYAYYCTLHPIVHRGKIIVEAEDTPVGSVNCDETVNAIDAALVLQYGAGIISSLGCEDKADTNEDGAINAIDAALILQYGAGIIASLPPS
jgi:plastocyanin